MHSAVSETALDLERRQEMTEKEKMEHQKIYNANYDQKNWKQENPVQNTLPKIQLPSYWEYSGATRVHPDDIRENAGSICHIEPDFWCDYGYRIKVGENFMQTTAWSFLMQAV